MLQQPAILAFLLKRYVCVRTLHVLVGLHAERHQLCVETMRLTALMPHILILQSNVEIREVWADNLHDEMRKIIELVDRFNYIAMDTEFPGVVTRPTASCRSNNEYNYQLMKLNVDSLKMIQLGICLCDENGNYIPNLCCWQFNFKFNQNHHVYAVDSLELLKKSGIEFSDLESRGIDWVEFAEVMMTSGIVLNPKVNWISFHSGFDFAYLLRVLTNSVLPETDTAFFECLQIFCPVIYDIKYIMKSCENLRGGLQKIAETLDVHRIGPQHQAGSDALLTAATFFKMRADYFDSVIDDAKYRGVIFGLTCPPFSGTMPTPCSAAQQAATAAMHENFKEDGEGKSEMSNTSHLPSYPQDLSSRASGLDSRGNMIMGVKVTDKSGDRALDKSDLYGDKNGNGGHMGAMSTMPPHASLSHGSSHTKHEHHRGHRDRANQSSNSSGSSTGGHHGHYHGHSSSGSGHHHGRHYKSKN